MKRRLLNLARELIARRSTPAAEGDAAAIRLATRCADDVRRRIGTPGHPFAAADWDRRVRRLLRRRLNEQASADRDNLATARVRFDVNTAVSPRQRDGLDALLDSEQAEFRERQARAVARAFRRLSPAHRTVLNLMIVEPRSLRDAARQMKRSPSYVHALLAEAIRALRERYEHPGDD